MHWSQLIKFAGGLVMFLFGMNLVRNSLEKASGDKLRSIINRLIKDRLRSFATGVFSTFIMESSGAATVMFVGFASVGVLDLFQSMALTAGATVGTTLFVLILAKFIKYELSNFSMVMVIIGFVVTILKKKGTLRYIGDAFIGFGVLFLGVYFMISSLAGIEKSAFFTSQLQMFSKNPALAILFSGVFTAVIHSSAGTIGIALSLASLNMINLEGAIPIVIGANIGTCFTAILASLNAPVNGKRVAWGHLVIKVVGAVVIYPFIGLYAHFIEGMTANLNYQVALSHFFFNLFNSILVIAGLNLYVKFLEKLIPEEEEDPERFSSKFLDPGALENPSVAFGNVEREILRMADIDQEMLKMLPHAFERNDMEIVEKFDLMDDKVDMLNREIKFYLAKITQSALTSEQSKKEMDLINITNYLEIIGDIMSKTMMALAVKKIRKGLEFSAEGWKDLKSYHAKVLENFHIAVTSFASKNVELARSTVRAKKRIGDMEEELKQAHFMRLASGTKESLMTSSIHLELLGHLRRVNSYITKVSFMLTDQWPTE